MSTIFVTNIRNDAGTAVRNSTYTDQAAALIDQREALTAPDLFGTPPENGSHGMPPRPPQQPVQNATYTDQAAALIAQSKALIDQAETLIDQADQAARQPQTPTQNTAQPDPSEALERPDSSF